MLWKLAVCAADEHVIKVRVFYSNAKLPKQGWVRAINMTEFRNFPFTVSHAGRICFINQAMDVSAESMLLRILRLHKLLGGAAHGPSNVRSVQVVYLGDALERPRLGVQVND